MLTTFALLAMTAQRHRPIVTPYARKEPLAIRMVEPSEARVATYGMVELAVDLTATYDNPFDPIDFTLDAEVVGPDGKTVSIPGFLYRPYTRKAVGDEEHLDPAGEPGWRVRFSPQIQGKHTIHLVARDRSGRTRSGPIVVEATAPESPGFVRVSARDSRFFEFSDGTAYWPLGPNVCWAQKGTFDYESWFAKYGEQGVNYSRLWLSPSWTSFGLERKGKASEGLGMGQFDLANAWRLDSVLRTASRHGLYLMLCIESYNVLRREEDGYPFWKDTPHNVDNGGPLGIPEEFWTNEKMDQLFKNKLRYLVARYGAFASTMAWEFWNEVDLTSGFDVSKVKAWHQRMGQHLRQIDPYRHLITTSASNTMGFRELDLLPELDYFQTHHYGPDPALTTVVQQSRKGGLGRPHYVGEIGADATGPRREDDPKGYQVHDPLWASIASGSSGNAAAWWWDNLIEPQNLYPLFGAAARFVKDVDWPREAFRQVRPTLSFATPPTTPVRKDLAFVNGPVVWQDSPLHRPQKVVVNARGAVGDPRLAGILHGTVNHPDWHNPVTFVVELDRPVVFELEVGDVSGYGGAALHVTLDGRRIVTRDYPDPDGLRDTKTLSQYKNVIRLTIPKGKHTLEVRNPGTDWVMIGYRFKDLLPRTTPPLEAWSVVGNTKVLAWVRLEGLDWPRAIAGKLPPAPPSVLRLAGLASGPWRAEIWDTWQGKVMRSSTVRVDTSGIVRVPLPSVTGDLALKLIKTGG